MPSPIEAITTAALSAALDAATRQHGVIAGNIANSTSNGYTPMRLSFDEQLAAARTTWRERGRLDEAALDVIRELRETVPEAGALGASVQLDVEMSELARNAVHFQALTQGVARHLSILALAAADGKK
jgi:flagellar basal-body rod protein FlgB